MALFVAGITEAYIVNNAQSKLANLRRALEDCANFQAWLAGLSGTDLTTAPIGMSSSDASALTSAMADANAVNQLYTTGLPPATYPQPPSAYVYAASQRAIIGPLS